MDDVVRSTKIQQDSDQSVVECLTDEINWKAERSKHVLTALHAASVPLDLQTAEVLHDLGCQMSALIQAACDD
jgi:hypothetical protein